MESDYPFPLPISFFSRVVVSFDKDMQKLKAFSEALSDKMM